MVTEGWIERYRGGAHEAVWGEIVALGEGVRAAAVLPAAQAVARELMGRVRRDVERLSARWRGLGYTFGYAWAGRWTQEDVRRSPRHLGSPGAFEIGALDRFEREIGPLPLSLRAFYEIVGSVNFVGDGPGGPEGKRWPEIEAFDPLQIVGFTSQMKGLLRSGREDREIEICPDHLHKYFISGVGSITTAAPDAGADATLVFEGEPIQWKDEPLRLVPYLREVILRRGGIGLVADPDRGLAAELTEGLDPF